MALVGNILNPKIEEVSYEDGRTLAEEINSVLGYICTKKAIGIDELFHNIGRKVLNPNSNLFEEKKQYEEKLIQIEKNK